MHMRVVMHLSDRRYVSLTKAAVRGRSIPKVGKNDPPIAHVDQSCRITANEMERTA